MSAPSPEPLPVTNDILDHRRIALQGERLLYTDPPASEKMLKRALSLAPLDAYLWSRLSVARFYSGLATSPEAAVVRALEFGRADTRIRLEQAMLAADFWDAASPTTQVQWIANLEILAEKMPRQTVTYAVSVDRLERLCEHGLALGVIGKACPSGLKSERRSVGGQ